jgi:hypothetical protein
MKIHSPVLRLLQVGRQMEIAKPTGEFIQIFLMNAPKIEFHPQGKHTP